MTVLAPLELSRPCLTQPPPTHRDGFGESSSCGVRRNHRLFLGYQKVSGVSVTDLDHVTSVTQIRYVLHKTTSAVLLIHDGTALLVAHVFGCVGSNALANAKLS